jgi:hypothetical protein
LSTSLKIPDLCEEPTIDELLSDPIAQVVMRYDGIDEAVVRHVMDEAARRMRSHSCAA